jgi:hypothetical protein
LASEFLPELADFRAILADFGASCGNPKLSRRDAVDSLK